jgi:hypothetical protein
MVDKPPEIPALAEIAIVRYRQSPATAMAEEADFPGAG